MNVLYFCSDAFVHVVSVSIVSLLENNKEKNDIEIYLVDDGISKEKKQKLKAMVELRKGKITFLTAPDPSLFFDFPFRDRYQMGHSYMRMCVGSLVPNSVDRLLCLDSDTLVLEDLTELWNIDLGNNILAGVADCVNVNAFRRQFMLEKKDIYCNAGVFLIDLKAWRNNKIEDIIRTVIKNKNGNIFFFEQTLMNYCCRNSILKLDAKYNSYTLFYAFKYKNLIRWRRPSTFYTAEEVIVATNTPAIIHYTRNFYMTSRPWIENCAHPMTEIYLKYKLLTPWPILSKDERRLWGKMKYKFIHLFPHFFLVYVINILYNLVRPLLYWKNE